MKTPSTALPNSQPTCYYGPQTKMALANFPFTMPRADHELVLACVRIKRAAAIANCREGRFDITLKDAIVEACDRILADGHKDQFVTPALQGGAGTSIHMNVNEVIAGLATEILGRWSAVQQVSPNDHVNASQSTNDVLPSALKLAAHELLCDMIAVTENLAVQLELKASEFKNVQKLGRTHLQDAVPTTLGAEFAAYGSICRRHVHALRDIIPMLRELNLSGTAIGNSINASKTYAASVYRELSVILGYDVHPANNLMAATSSQTDFLRLSQALVALTLDMSKIASDLRLLSSGPRGGFGEIRLRPQQPGSSIMPGKVNPVLPEAVNQLYFHVSANNLAIEHAAHAAHAAQLELGVMFPTIADRLLSSLRLSTEILGAFSSQCVPFITDIAERCRQHLDNSTAYATLLTPLLGYEKVSEMVKASVASGEPFSRHMNQLELGSLDEMLEPVQRPGNV